MSFNNFQNASPKRDLIPPDYSDCHPTEDDDEDDDDIDLDDDDDDIEDEDPAEEEKKLEEDHKEESSFQPRNSYQNTNQMATPTWPGAQTTPTSPWQQNQPSWGSGSSAIPWNGSRPASTSPWGTGQTNPTTSWGTSNSSINKEELNRHKKVILCDVLDCLVTTLDGPQKIGLVPRGVWDIMPRLDVWSALRRFTNIERIYAMIPRSLILNSSGQDSWQAFLNYEACALGEFLKIPTKSIQILTQSYIAQSKLEMISSVVRNIPTEDIVYIGIQSGFPGQSSADIDCADALAIDYMDLNRFLTFYS